MSKTTTRRKAKAKAVEAVATEAQLPATQAVAAPAPEKTKKVSRTTPVELGSLERVLLQGDLSGLKQEERIEYYRRVCATVGLNPLTKPFEYLTLDNKLVLYATKSCAAQLSVIYKLSVGIQSITEENELMTVRARASAPDGRFNDAIGVVDLKGQTGKNRANAMMKAETKARRRAVLSMCGLSFLDEEEIDAISSQSTPSAGASAVQQLVGTFVPSATSQVSPEVRQISANPESREEPKVTNVAEGRNVDEGANVQEGGKVIEGEKVQDTSQEGTAKRKNSAGVLYPAPEMTIITALKAERHVPWLLWIESEGFWEAFKEGGTDAFQKDFAFAIKMVRNYGGAHWSRCKKAFLKAGVTLEP